MLVGGRDTLFSWRKLKPKGIELEHAYLQEFLSISERLRR